METLRIQPDARLNVLLTEDRPHAGEHWTFQLPRLLEPQGVAAYIVRTVQEAMTVADRLEVHAAIIDLGTPLGTMEGTPPSDANVMWILELFGKLHRRPPIVVVHSPARSRREGDWILSQSLRLGAFSVLNKPVNIEQLLGVFQKLVDREYRGTWPGRPKGPPPRPAPGQQSN